MRAFTVRLTTVVVLLFSGTAIARAQDPIHVTVQVGPGPDAPTTHAYVTEFFRQRSGCRSLVVPWAVGSYSAFFEFRSGEGHSVLVWDSRVELPNTFGEFVHETSGEQTIAGIVRNVCDFIKTR